MLLYYKNGRASAKFMEVAPYFHPRGIPKWLASRGADVAVRNVEYWLAYMGDVVDCDLYTDHKLRNTRFKSPFGRRPLVGRRPRRRNNEEKRSRRLVGSSNPYYILQCEEAAFGDFDMDDYEYEDEQ